MGQHASKRNRKLKNLDKLHEKVPNMNIDEIMDAYKDFTRQSRGKNKLTKKDFKAVYKHALGDKATSLAGHIYDAFDVNGDGKVDFEEFLVGLSMTEPKGNSDSKGRTQRLRWAFNVYDEDRSGTIDKEEMRNIVKAVFDLGISSDEHKTAVEFADELFAQVDKNGDGDITFEEFAEAAEKNESLIDMLLPGPES